VRVGARALPRFVAMQQRIAMSPLRLSSGNGCADENCVAFFRACAASDTRVPGGCRDDTKKQGPVSRALSMSIRCDAVDQKR
jgi:hypothetical protein